MTASVFTLSIEPTSGAAFTDDFHLGTIEWVARNLAEEIFTDREWFRGHGRVTIRTVALMRDGRVFDVFDGEWMSDLYEADMAEQEAEAAAWGADIAAYHAHLDREAERAAYDHSFDDCGMAEERARHP